MTIGSCAWKERHRAHEPVYAQPLVTLTWSMRTPKCAWCTYEQKADGPELFEGGSARAFEKRRLTSGQVGRCA